MWQQPGCLRVNSAPQCQAVWQYVLHSSQPVCVLIETQWWPPAWCVCVCADACVWALIGHFPPQCLQLCTTIRPFVYPTALPRALILAPRPLCCATAA